MVAHAKRCQLCLSHLRSAVAGEREGLAPEQNLWLAVVERALHDLRSLSNGERYSAYRFLTNSPLIRMLGLNPEWVQSLIRHYDLVGAPRG